MISAFPFRILWRRLAASPGLAGVSLLLLAVGVGATVSIFTVVNAVLLRPLPVPESERLVTMMHVLPGVAGELEYPISDSLYFLYADESRTLDGVAAVRESQASFTDPERPQRVPATRVTASFFDVMRTPPRLGRVFTAEDERAGSESVILLSDGLWRARFAADPHVVGRIVDVDGARAEIVGVMPPGFGFPRPEAGIWQPLRLRQSGLLGAFRSLGVGRIADGSTLDEVRAELDAMLSNLVEIFPNEYAAPYLADAGIRPVVEPAREFVVSDFRATLWILLSAVGLLFLVACANVANLFLVRFEARHGEIAVRAALGEPRGRLGGSLLLESLAIGVAGGGAALLLAPLLVRWLVRVGPRHLPRLDEVAVDGPAVLFGVGLSVAAGLFCGCLPSVRALLAAARPCLPAGARAATAGRGRQHARRGLVAAQIALALTLLVGSGLTVRSFQKLAGVDPGFDPADVLTFGVELPEQFYVTPGSRLNFHRELVARLRALPGAAGAAAATAVPLGGSGSTYTSDHGLEGRPEDADGVEPMLRWKRVSPGYFGAMGIPFVEGRDFDRPDAGRQAPVAVVSRSLARTYWPGESAIGKGIRPGGLPAQKGDGWFRIVGVVDDVHELALDGDPPPMAYYPLVVANAGDGDVPWRTGYVVRTENAESFTEAVARTVRDLDARLPISDVATLETLVAQARAGREFVMILLAIAAGSTLLLGAVGLYGVVSCSIAQRRREIAVRVAVGAQAGDVRRLVLAEAGWMVLAGMVPGIGAAALLARRFQVILFETNPFDPVVFVAVSAVLVAACLLASWLPARRAARVDPVAALGAG